MASEEQHTHSAVPLWRSYRGLLALMGTVAFMFMYLLRINLSVAMVCMVKEPAPINMSMDYNRSIQWRNDTDLPLDQAEEELDGCGQMEQRRRAASRGEFEWSKTVRGYVLSSFYYGYIITQIPGGWLASQVGGKHVLGSGLLISIVATLFIPLAARTHIGMVITMRIIMGMGMGVVFPSMHALIGRWAPPFERTKITSFTYAGTMIGTVAAMSISGLLCSLELDNGWPLIFYIFGGAGILWWVGWILTVYSSPGAHPRISEAEILHIHETVGVTGSTSRLGVRVPWRNIWTSMPVWAIVVGHVCTNWGSYTILSCIPMYMREVLKFDIKQNGLLSALPYVCMYVACVGLATVIDTIRAKRLVSTTNIRKITQGISFLGPAVLIGVMGYMDCSRRGAAVALLTIAVMLTACGRCGYVVNHLDIAPRFAGILFGISNTAATVPGMIAPTIAGALTPNGTQAEWQVVFWICSGAYAFGALFYIVFASGEEQEWAKQRKTDTHLYPATDFDGREEKAEAHRLQEKL